MARLVTLIAGCVCFCGASAATADDAKSFNDATFVQKAAMDGMHEVMLGKIVESKTKNEAVKTFAQRMVNDHTRIDADLKKAALTAGIAVPDKLDEEFQKEVDRFKNYKGSDFDRDYSKAMVSDHEQAVALFTQASKEAKNPAIKEFATKNLPIIKEHLMLAKKLVASME